VQFARGVDRLRVEAKRTGSSMTLTVNASDPQQYDWNGAVVAVAGAAEFTSSGAITFDAPFGVSPLNVETAFSLRSTRDPTVTRTVRVIGLLGKVVIE